MQNYSHWEGEIRYEATRTVRKSAMLLILRKTLRNAVTLCAFEKIRKPITAKKRTQEKTIGSKGERTGISEFGWQVEKRIVHPLTAKVHTTISHISTNYWILTYLF